MFFLSKQEKSKVKKKTGENGSCYCLFQIWPLTHIFTSFSLQFLFNVTVDSPLFFCQIPDTISRIEHGNLKNLQLEIDLLLMLYFSDFITQNDQYVTWCSKPLFILDLLFVKTYESHSLMAPKFQFIVLLHSLKPEKWMRKLMHQSK